jgi:hypothetical protein
MWKTFDKTYFTTNEVGTENSMTKAEYQILLFVM